MKKSVMFCIAYMVYGATTLLFLGPALISSKSTIGVIVGFITTISGLGSFLLSITFALSLIHFIQGDELLEYIQSGKCELDNRSNMKFFAAMTVIIAVGIFAGIYYQY